MRDMADRVKPWIVWEWIEVSSIGFDYARRGDHKLVMAIPRGRFWRYRSAVDAEIRLTRAEASDKVSAFVAGGQLASLWISTARRGECLWKQRQPLTTADKGKAFRPPDDHDG